MPNKELIERLRAKPYDMDKQAAADALEKADEDIESRDIALSASVSPKMIQASIDALGAAAEKFEAMALKLAGDDNET